MMQNTAVEQILILVTTAVLIAVSVYQWNTSRPKFQDADSFGDLHSNFRYRLRRFMLYFMTFVGIIASSALILDWILKLQK